MFPLTEFETAILVLSLQVAVTSVLICLPFGLGAAWLLARINFAGKALLDAIFHLPLILPPVVIGYLLLVLLGRTGLIGGWLYDTFDISVAFSWKGAAIASSVMAFPLMVRPIRLSLENVDERLESAAKTLGASELRTFLTITLPLITPGIISGTVLAFARALGEFGATITFVSNIPGETQTLPLALYSLTQQPNGEVGAMRLTLIAISVALITLILSEIIAMRINSRRNTHR